MSPDLASRSAYAANPVAERRVRLRYAVELDLRYKLTWRQQVLHEGSGKTCNFSRSSIFFRADQALPKGLAVELGRPPDRKKADIENTPLLTKAPAAEGGPSRCHQTSNLQRRRF